MEPDHASTVVSTPAADGARPAAATVVSPTAGSVPTTDTPDVPDQATRHEATASGLPGASSRGRWPVIAGVVAGGVAMLATLVIVLEFGGAAPKRLPADLAGADPGMVTGWGLPVSRLLCDAAGVGTVGALLAAAFLFPAAGGKPGAAGRRMLRWASVTAWVWCVASLAQFAFTVSDLIGKPLPAALTAHDVGNVIDAVPQPRALLIGAATACAIAVGAGVARKLDTCAWLTAVALFALLPVAMTGHAHGSGGHDLATVSGGLHVLSVSAWVGGLAALLLGGRSLAGPELLTAVRRYSGIAGLCLVVVTISGLVNAYVRVVAFDALFDSRYGNLVIAKTVALVLLAGCGAAHRQFTIRRLAAGTAAPASRTASGNAAAPGDIVALVDRANLVAARRPFLRLGAAEVTLMGVAIALGAGLSRTATPAAADGATSDNPVVAILGYPMPPAISIARIFTEARPDLLFGTIVLLGTWFYLVGAVRQRRAGAPWPIGRTVSWVCGMAVIAFATSSGLGRYGRVLFSVHMVQHLLLMMLAPILLNLGAPVTLALRALPTGVTGTTRSARAWLLRMVNSRWLAFIGNPLVAWTLYSVSLYVLYLTPLFGWVLRNHLAHLAMMVHFLVVGYLFFWVLIGVDPGPKRPSHPARIILLFTASAVHTFFGIILMMSGSVIGDSYYSLLTRSWGASSLTDQHLGGGMAWSFGELPGVAVIAVLVFQWARTDERRARAKDARMDSGDDDEFDQYNAYLAGLATRDGRSGR
ncbi:cytochrome c oxidase assembly protein [Frankia sp. AgB1.8]|uniref:cytochrome c oxidase assembly protein n=1 Tax=Frankia sp. AgB1.8 TaxID=2792839 RepID=UPI0019322696|nr:cytochrome c oxidase assembly protein [Frankia sp. AgB1.8]MBL7623034.1 bifunctional copper resistance protein CopD/cytochrome c oxidase assembly protein [Frankia sp. AgB1.8]